MPLGAEAQMTTTELSVMEEAIRVCVCVCVCVWNEIKFDEPWEIM